MPVTGGVRFCKDYKEWKKDFNRRERAALKARRNGENVKIPNFGAESIQHRNEEAYNILRNEIIPKLMESDNRYLRSAMKKSEDMALSPVDKAKRFEAVLQLVKKGMPAMEIDKHIAEEYGVCEHTAQTWRSKAMSLLNEYVIKDAETIRSQQMLRLEGILNKAIENNELKTANSIIETMNKVAGLYNQKPDNIIAPVISFKFSGMEDISEPVVNEKIMNVVKNIEDGDIAEDISDVVFDAYRNGML